MKDQKNYCLATDLAIIMLRFQIGSYKVAIELRVVQIELALGARSILKSRV